MLIAAVVKLVPLVNTKGATVAVPAATDSHGVPAAIPTPAVEVVVEVVNLPAAAVVTPIEVLLIVLAAVGFTVKAPTGEIATVPVPLGDIATAAFAGDKVTAALAVKVVNDPGPDVNEV